MKIWLLKPTDPDAGYWEAYWERPADFLVAAEDENEARLSVSRACQESGGASGAPWLDQTRSVCSELTAKDVVVPQEIARDTRLISAPERYPADRRRKLL